MNDLVRAEIAEQPEALAATIHTLMGQVPELRHLFRGRTHVLLLGRGTSDNAAIYGRYLVEIETGARASLGAPSVATLYGVRLDLRDTIAVLVSQSGGTAELVDAAAWARAMGATTVAVTNTAGSMLATVCDTALVTQAGPERAIPATKSYTTALAAFAVLAVALAPRSPTWEASLARVPEEAQRLIQCDPRAAVEHLWSSASLVVTGRSFTLSTALELALKIQETSGRPCFGLSHADLQHGPAALLGPQAGLIVVAPPDGPTLPGLVAAAERARRLGSRVVSLGGNDGLREIADIALPGPQLPEALAPIVLAIPGQLLAVALAARSGLDADAPSGLTKITQTVQ